MTLLIGVDPASFPQVSQSRVKYVFDEFIKHPTIPAVKCKQYAHANMLVIINALGALQDNWLKHNHPLRVTLPSSYTVEIHRKGSDKSSTEFSGRYVVSLGWHTYELFKPIFTLTILCDYAIQIVSWVLVHPILVYHKEHVVGS